MRRADPAGSSVGGRPGVGRAGLPPRHAPGQRSPVTTPLASDPAARPTAAAAVRRHLLHLVLGVVALDTVAIAVYRLAGVERWPAGRQQLFTVAWVALTLVVVSVFLSRIRTARIRARRARAQAARR